ncbi:MAG: hypothetical protein PHS37_04990, partial [Candidatus Omnitrophica bacterium]|nr:hypothetical protein [Candidatus Omnitrophota bacterium]
MNNSRLFCFVLCACIFFFSRGDAVAANGTVVPRIVATNLDGNSTKDIVVNFGRQYGNWIYHDNATWTHLNAVSASSITVCDLDENGKDDLIVDFGSQYGILIYHDNAIWEQLNREHAKFITTGDVDGNGKKDIIVDFGVQYGIWIYHDNATWTQLNAASASSITVSDLNGNGKDDLIIDFGSQYGIWIYHSDGIWTLLNQVSASVDPANPDFIIKGSNLPWGAYGQDIGNTSQGFSSPSGRTRLDHLMSLRQNSVVRVWLFCDLRSGVNFNSDGSMSFKDPAAVYADMNALLVSAADNNVKIILVLFDRTLSVIGDVANCSRGPHPEVITEPSKRAALINLFANQFVERYVGNRIIYAWDILNEPEVAPEVMPGVVTNQQQWDFIRQFAEMIRGKIVNSGSSQLVTTANKERQYMIEMLKYWDSQGYSGVLSLYQFHYYNAMGKAALNPLTAGERSRTGNTPIVIGEVSSTSNARSLGDKTWTEITEKLDYIYQNGFAGGLFWHDDTLNNTAHDDLFLSEEEWLECVDWTPDSTETYYTASGRRESKVFLRPDFHGVLYYHYEDADTLAVNKGRMDKLVYATAGYEGAMALAYEYPSDPNIKYMVNAYENADYTDRSNPVLWSYIKTYTYRQNGA